MIREFIECVDHLGLNVNSVMVTQGDTTSTHIFTEDNLCSIRSISKVISCLGVYKAIQSGMFDMESFVMPFFPEIKITNVQNKEYLSKLKIKHLMNLTMGHEDGLMFSKDMKAQPCTNWLEYVFNYPILHNPGEFFVYNNANTYILSAIVQKNTGKNFSDWVRETVLSHLGIFDYAWENSAQGICLGASGIRMKNVDMHKIALLLLRNGVLETGQQLISPSWVSEMSKPQFITANLPEYAAKQGRSLNKMAYGLNLWICGNGTREYPKEYYFCDGTDGQFLIVIPKKELAITILSNQKDMNPFYEIFNSFVQ